MLVNETSMFTEITWVEKTKEVFQIPNHLQKVDRWHLHFFYSAIKHYFNFYDVDFSFFLIFISSLIPLKTVYFNFSEVIECSIVCSREIERGWKKEMMLHFEQYKTLFDFRGKRVRNHSQSERSQQNYPTRFSSFQRVGYQDFHP